MAITLSVVLWGVGIVLFYLLSRFLRSVWKFWRAVKLLNVDGLELLKRIQDRSIEDYLQSKYKEKEELLRFQILKHLRDKLSGEEDDDEKQFLQEFIELMEDTENEWHIVEDVKVLSGYYHSVSIGRWRKVWGDAITRTILEIGLTYDYKNGEMEERYRIPNLSDTLLKAVKDLQFCREALF